MMERRWDEGGFEESRQVLSVVVDAWRRQAYGLSTLKLMSAVGGRFLVTCFDSEFAGLVT